MKLKTALSIIQKTFLLLIIFTLSCTNVTIEESDSTKAKWTSFPSDVPDMKVSFVMAYDSSHHQIIAFGGHDKDFHRVADTWAYNSKTKQWKNMKPETSPVWRSSHSMVYDSTRKRMLMFGGG